MKDKVVIITGASSGIGRGLSKHYARMGSKVVMAARNREKLQELEQELGRESCEVFAVQTDVSREEDCRELVDKVVEKYGHIDVLINNAGISMRATFEDLRLDVIRQVMDVNFYGTIYCTKYALPYLLKTRGSVVAVSSIAGFKGLPGRSGYSASKAAIHGFLDVLRVENRKKGLHVLLACPGFTSSNIRKTALTQDGQPQGNTPKEESKLMSAEEVAGHIYKAVRRRRRILILTTQGKFTVLFNKLIPGVMDYLVYRHMAQEPDSPFK